MIWLFKQGMLSLSYRFLNSRVCLLKVIEMKKCQLIDNSKVMPRKHPGKPE